MADRRYRERDWLREKYVDERKTSNDIAEICDVDRSTIVRWLNKLDIETRDVSDYDGEELTKKAREAVKEKYGEGGYLKELWEKDKESQTKVAQENAHKGTPARKKNGMSGRTGQENPNWRGGKSVYDAVKKQLPGDSWRKAKVDAKEADGYYCQNCGSIGVKLDSHHIVPIMAGGTNEKWNLITLCESCHTKAESFIRQYPEFDPVLVE